MTEQHASHSALMDNSECFMFGNICSCLVVLGNIGKYKPPSIVDIIIFLLGHLVLKIFVIGCTLFRWTDTVIKLSVHTESATAGFFSFVSCVFLVVGT